MSLIFSGSETLRVPVKFPGLSNSLTPMHTSTVPTAPMPRHTQQAADKNA